MRVGVATFSPARLLAARRTKGLTLDEFATRLNERRASGGKVARPNLTADEKGRQTPTPGRLIALAEALDVNALELTTIESVEQGTLADLLLWRHTTTTLAEQVGISTNYLRQVLAGSRPLTTILAARVAEALDIGQDLVETALHRGLSVRRSGQ